jgi:hypothetical protein
MSELVSHRHRPDGGRRQLASTLAHLSAQALHDAPVRRPSLAIAQTPQPPSS